jgi:hypothetical protein
MKSLEQTFSLDTVLFIVFTADRHLGFVVPHMRIQLMPGGQNELQMPCRQCILPTTAPGKERNERKIKKNNNIRYHCAAETVPLALKYLSSRFNSCERRFKII